MPKDKIKRVFVPTILAMLVAMTSMTLTTGAYAQDACVDAETTDRDGGLHFQGTPQVCADKSDDTATLTATGDLAGAGQGAGTATLEADVSVTVGCLTNEPRGNPGGGQNEPSGLREAAGTTTATAPFEATRQGHASFTVETESISIEDLEVDGETFECPSAQQTEVIVGGFTFSNIVLTIEAQTGTITATFPDVDP